MSDTGECKLIGKLAEVMAEVERIPKNGYNEHFRYHFAAETDVKTALRTALASRHIWLKSSIEDVQHFGNITEIRTRHAFIDAETGEREEFCWSSQGQDTQDKGVSKAATSAVKYALLASFLIPTGDDPDQDGPAKPQTRGQQPRTQAASKPKPPAMTAPAASGSAPPELATGSKAAWRDVGYADAQADKAKHGAALTEFNKVIRGAGKLPADCDTWSLGRIADFMTGGGAPPSEPPAQQQPSSNGYEPSAEEVEFFGSREQALDAPERERQQQPALPV